MASACQRRGTPPAASSSANAGEFYRTPHGYP